MGMTFEFYGNDYTQIYIGSNGYVTFNNSYITLTNDCPLPNSSTYANFIALMWDDLNPGSGGNIYYRYYSSCPTGSGACFVVEYNGVSHYGGSSSGIYEAVLYDGGDILLQYQNTGSENGSGSTTGIENDDSTAGVTYACDSTFPASAPFAICFGAPGTTGCP